MRYIGKQNWIQSLIFWALVFFAGIIVSTALFTAKIIIPLLSFAFGALITILLAHYWFKRTWRNSVEIYAVALIIDIIIVFVLMALGVGIGFLYGL